LKFAQQSGFDPLVPDNWYYVPAAEIRRIKHAKSMLQYYNGSVVKALTHLFPTVNFDTSKFLFLPKNFWQEAKNRRDFFTNFAADNNFDPLLPDNWYKISPAQLKQAKYADAVLRNEQNTYSGALINLFPAIGLDRSKFVQF